MSSCLKKTKISARWNERNNGNKSRAVFTGKKLGKDTVHSSGSTAKRISSDFGIVRSRKSAHPLEVFQNQKSTSFNVFQLLVPKEKIEIVVDDISAEMNIEANNEVQLLAVKKLSAGDKTVGNGDIADMDVVLLTDEERENLSDGKPEIIILDKSPQRELSISDEIICLQDLDLVSEAKPSSSMPQQKTMKGQQSESSFHTKLGIQKYNQSRSHCTDFENFPWIRNLQPSTSSLRGKDMPELVDLLTQGTLSICKKWLRKWEVVQSGVISGHPLRICSYNVLCQQTAYKTPELYTHLQKPGRNWELTWENRWRLFSREFSMIAADVFCLQEVQCDHYNYFFKPYFESAGFLGEYKKRTHSLADGCAIFYKSHLQLLHYQYIEYFVNNDSVLDRDNVGQLVRLKDRRNGREFCIANTHLLFNKQRGDVKLAQLAVILANIDKECGPDSAQECPYILCGDFNAHPNSPLYNFIMSGIICFSNLRRGDISGQGGSGGPLVSVNLLPEETNIDRNCQFKHLKNRTMLLPSPNCWSHPLCFNSVYGHLSTDSRPVVSTYHSIEAVNPDFIFYSVKSKRIKSSRSSNSRPAVNVTEKEIRLVRRLSLPSVNQLVGTLGPWPNSTTPSDHIPLIADFVLQ